MIILLLTNHLALMKNFFIAFCIFLIWSVLGIWFYACQIKGVCQSAKQVPDQSTVPVENITPTAPPTDSIITGVENLTPLKPGYFLARLTETVVLETDSASIFKKQVFDYLNLNQNKELYITAFFDSLETAQTAVDRAENLKKILVSFGINSDRVTVEPSANAIKLYETGSALSQNGFQLNYRDISEEKLANIEKGIANKTLYSTFASEGFEADNTLQAYAIELKAYLEKYPDKKVTITGHTDNVGEEIDNDWIGMERAKSAMKYLISQGIAAEKLLAQSKGEASPVADNATKEGRQQNRRIEITVN